MDFSKVLRDCYRKKESLERAIAALEQLIDLEAHPKRRGRHSMGVEERQQVAERMKKYWASRRKEKDCAATCSK